MSDSLAPPGWYPDPGGGGQRYFDGVAWTGYTAPWSVAAAPAWKGARYGRPHSGPGALADPGRRLGARLLDGLVLLPVVIVFAAIAIAVVAPHAGPMFPVQNTDANVSTPTPGFVWVYLAVFVAALICGVISVVYEAVATKRYGRTLGKRWMGIRPVTTEGAALGWGKAFGRALVYGFAGCLSWIGLIDYAWCLWDADSQCVHDKVVGTLVVRD